MKNRKIVIDGSILSNVHSGIHRFMIENLVELDKILEDGDVKVEIIYPRGLKIDIPKFENIKIKSLSYIPKCYRYIVLPLYLKFSRAVYCRMDNGSPVGKKNISCLHDLIPITKEGGYEESEVERYKNRYKLIAKNSQTIVTVSENSKNDICKYMKIPRERVKVVFNGWEHMQRICEDDKIFEKFPKLKNGDYVYALGNILPHKNFNWIKKVAEKNPNICFAIAGRMFQTGKEEEIVAKNIIYLGRVTDEENKALMKNCKLFVHPAKHEGFGIPPLEALACGAKIAISSASCLPEIYGDCAAYFEPDDYDISIEQLLKQEVADKNKVLDKYSWKKSAQRWYDIFKDAL